MTNQPNDYTIDFRSLVIPIFVFALLIIGLVAGLSYASRERSRLTEEKYRKETAEYIQKNKQAFATIFTEVFPQKENCYELSMQARDCAYRDVTPMQYLSDDITDFSSMAFIIKSGTRPGTLLIMDLNGTVGNFYTYEKEGEIRDLLSGKIESLPWDDYTYTFHQKELIVPVKDSKGNIMGAIVKGILEK